MDCQWKYPFRHKKAFRSGLTGFWQHASYPTSSGRMASSASWKVHGRRGGRHVTRHTAPTPAAPVAPEGHPFKNGKMRYQRRSASRYAHSGSRRWTTGWCQELGSGRQLSEVTVGQHRRISGNGVTRRNSAASGPGLKRAVSEHSPSGASPAQNHSVDNYYS